MLTQAKLVDNSKKCRPSIRMVSNHGVERVISLCTGNPIWRMSLKILIARLNHETNTFSPAPTPLAAFDPVYGEDAYQANLGMRTAMAAFIDLAEKAGATLITPLSAMANPSGPVHACAYDELTACILAAAPGCDAVLLDLHGAMVAENTPDGEGDLLERLRHALPTVPIGVALDLHGNITQKSLTTQVLLWVSRHTLTWTCMKLVSTPHNWCWICFKVNPHILFTGTRYP
jgi:hypothetical protein